MKLLFLTHDSSCIGGAQKCLLDLIKGIKEIHADWKLYMIFPDHGDMIDKCSPYLEDYFVLKMKWQLVSKDKISFGKRISYINRLIRSTRKLITYLRLVRPDYTISNTIVIPHLALACMYLKIKHIWFLHEVPNKTWSNIDLLFGKTFTFKAVNKLSYKVIVPSEYANRYYQSYIDTFKLSVLEQAVELSIPQEDKIVRTDSRYTLLMVGAFDTNKGQIELLKAVRQIKLSGNDIHVFLVGPDIGEMHTCSTFIYENQLDKMVDILPFTENVAYYYSLSDVVLICSQVETFGRVAVEAQLCGLPVILSNVGANPERIKDGVNGLLYAKGNVDDLYHKIEALRPDNLRKQFAENIDAVHLKKKYSVAEFADRFSSII